MAACQPSCRADGRTTSLSLQLKDSKSMHDQLANTQADPEPPATSAEPVAEPSASHFRPRLRIARLRDLALIPAILAIGIIGIIVSPVFLTQSNIINILQQQSEISLVVLGEAMILVAGRLDLSLESTVGLAPGIAVWLVLPKNPGHGQGLELAGGWAVPVTLGVGLLIGLLNGVLIVTFELNGFIV